MAETMGIALGMIETRGLVPAIEAADAMTKAAVAMTISDIKPSIVMPATLSTSPCLR